MQTRQIDVERDLSTVGARLRYARARKGKIWTQAHLAAAADVGLSTIGMIEAGHRMSKGSLPALAHALGVRYFWLLKAEGPMVENIPAQHAMLQDESKEPAMVSSLVESVVESAPRASDQANLTRYISTLGALLNAIPVSSRAEAVASALQALIAHLPQPPNS
jgi:transcriptional regulator with XRE-family HTH domain